MGLHRRFVSFAKLVSPVELAQRKHQALDLELKYSEDETGRRKVNVDPGYLEAGKVVLASTKNANHRIYVDAGIYAEATLAYVAGKYQFYEYTYPDYRLSLSSRAITIAEPA